MHHICFPPWWLIKFSFSKGFCDINDFLFSVWKVRKRLYVDIADTRDTWNDHISAFQINIDTFPRGWHHISWKCNSHKRTLCTCHKHPYHSLKLCTAVCCLLSAFNLLAFGQFSPFSFQTPAALMGNGKWWKIMNCSQDEQSKCVLHGFLVRFHHHSKTA